MASFLTPEDYQRTITANDITFYKAGWAKENDSLEKAIHFMKLLKSHLEKVGEEKFNDSGMTRHVLNAVKKLYPENDSTTFIFTVDKVGCYSIEIGIKTGSSPTVDRSITVHHSQLTTNLFEKYLYNINRIIDTWASQHELNQKGIDTIEDSAVVYNATLETIINALPDLPKLPYDLTSTLGLYKLV